jgi:hypothetical protein
MTFLYSNIPSISKIHNFNIAMLSVCLSVCLSVAFKILNRVNDCYKYCVNSMMTWRHHDALVFNWRLLVITKRTCELLRCEQYVLLTISCVLLDRGEM